jgi:superfamily I DNA/RNA helicase
VSAAYLAKLNPEQRRAVEHGVRAGGTAALPLPVIAGAGSGKTNTLAHRVAHLIVEGADPRRILLLTFSRRAAAEMARRVERISVARTLRQTPPATRRKARPGARPDSLRRGSQCKTRQHIL